MTWRPAPAGTDPDTGPGKLIPGEGDLPAPIALEPMRIRWHLHRWSIWSRPYATGGVFGIFSGGAPRQSRKCTWCGLMEDRSCLLPSPPRPMRIRLTLARLWARCRDAVRRTKA